MCVLPEFLKFLAHFFFIFSISLKGVVPRVVYEYFGSERR
jgi:hypothetical protein